MRASDSPLNTCSEHLERQERARFAWPFLSATVPPREFVQNEYYTVGNGEPYAASSSNHGGVLLLSRLRSAALVAALGNPCEALVRTPATTRRARAAAGAHGRE